MLPKIDPQFRFRDVEHLPPGHPDLTRAGQVITVAGAHRRRVPHDHIRVGHLGQGGAPTSGWRPGPHPERDRNDFSTGLANPSDGGGFEELPDNYFNRASSSAIRASACSNRTVGPACNANNSSYDGGSGSAGTTGRPTSLHNRQPPGTGAPIQLPHPHASMIA